MSIRNLFSQEFPFSEQSVSLALSATTSNLSGNVTINDSRTRTIRMGDIVLCYAFFDITTSDANPYSFRMVVPVAPADNFTTNIQCAGISVWDNNGTPTTGTLQVVAASTSILVSQPSTAASSGKLIVHFGYEVNI